jgi:hypothetical protein
MDANMIAAKLAVEALIKDLKDRQGIGDEWEQIDSDIQEEIKDTWTMIVLNEIENS